MTVEKGKGNKLSASVKYDGAGSLTITNTYASTSAELKATKEINEWGKAESFTFELAAVTEGAPMPGKTTAKATKKAPEASFGNITFEKAGTYEYTITEQDGGAGGVTYDTTPHKVVVTVSKEDGTNKLNAEVKYDGKDSLTITNTYKAEGSVVLEALKELTGETGRVLKPEQFSFELYEGGELKQTKKNGDGGKITFDAIKYTKEGTYTYTIKEVIETKNGYTFDTAEKRVTVTVVDNGDGTMTATPVYDGGAAVFTNTYEASGSASLKAFKTLENRTLEDKQFIFELVNDKTGVPMHTVYNDANGNIVFPAISYTKPGTYNYTIREIVRNEKGYTYDSSEKKAVVTVTDLDEGILATTVTYDGSEEIPEFVNKYEASVSVKKTDVASGEELEGATIQIIDESGKVVDEWVSTKKAHETTGLKTGTTYTLHETVAPDGYTIAADTKFTIDEFGKVTSEGTITQDGILLVEDTLTNVKVSKTDIASGEELEGATIQIIDKDGKVVEEWVSTKEVHEVKGLKTGEEYTLHETVAPDGYTVASDTKFTIDETGKVTSTGTITEGGVMLVEDAMTEVKVSKTDIASGEELEGATIQIIDSKGKVVEEWVSTKEVHEVKGLKTGEEYTLHETVAPDGYTVASDTKFTIDETGKVTSTGTITEGGVMLVEDAMTEIKVSKTDIASGEELEGATIQIIDKDGKVVEEWVSTKEAHVVKGLKTGEEYTLHETVAPNGYSIAADTKFVLNEDGTINAGKTTATVKDGVLLVEDSYNGTKILKVDEDGKPLGGAKLQIEDGKGYVIAKWTSYSTGPVQITDLRPNVHYFLVETKAPSGYKKASTIEFYVKTDGTIVVVSGGGKVVNNVLVMTDKKVTTKPGKKQHRSTRTGDDANAALWAALAAAAMAGAAGTVAARRKKKGRKS